MEQHNTNTTVAEKSIADFAIPQQNSAGVLVEGQFTMQLPLRYAGGNLGLTVGGKIFVDIADANASRFVAYSVEWILRNIDCFAPGRGKTQLLAGAALHYGLDPYALFDRDIEATRQLHREGKL